MAFNPLSEKGTPLENNSATGSSFYWPPSPNNWWMPTPAAG